MSAHMIVHMLLLLVVGRLNEPRIFYEAYALLIPAILWTVDPERAGPVAPQPARRSAEPAS